MRRNLIVFGCFAIALTLAVFVLKEWLSSGELKIPERPPEVPSAATWIGEEWGQCNQAGNTPLEFRCEFYDDVNGKKVLEGRFVWRGRGDAPVRAGVFLEEPGWDGTALSFDGGSLAPADEQP